MDFPTTETKGGSHIDGDVTAGRDFVGRDQFNVNIYVTSRPTTA